MELIPFFLFFPSETHCLPLPHTPSTCFLLFSARLFSFLLSSTPVSSLVIYSGQSVPPLSPSLREDEEEWCCFIMYLSATCEEMAEKKAGGKMDKRLFFLIAPLHKNNISPPS